MEKNNNIAKWMLRIGLAFVFVYATVEIYVHPANFLKYIPSFILDAVPVEPFLHVFGVMEVVLALWLLSGWKGEYSALSAALMIAGIVVFNFEHFQVLFRNVAITFAGLALMLLEMKVQKKKESQTLSRTQLVA